MGEISNIHFVATGGFIIAAIFGFVANKTHFCVMGAISDALHMGSKGRLGAWFLAIGFAILGAQALQLAGLVDLSQSIYLTTNFTWLGYALGGVLFGIGMTLAAGCGQRNLVRLGGGNLKALVVLLVLGITAYMTMRGLLAAVRVNYINLASVDVSTYGLADQGIVTAIASAAGADDSGLIRTIVALAVGLGFVLYAFKQKSFRHSFDNILAGVVIGGCVVAAWYVTGHLGADDFDPVPTEGITFIGPMGNAVNYLMTYTGATINFGIALVAGTILGSLIYSVWSGNFRIETFTNRSEMLSHLIGAVLMGFGGVLSLGCTIGQGVTGMSTLAMGSVIALVSIVFGSALTMKIQYCMLDDKGFVDAVGCGFTELLSPMRRGTS